MELWYSRFSLQVISWHIHSDNRLSRIHGEYVHVNKAYYRIVSVRFILQCKNENCMNFVVLLGIEVLGDILISNLESTSGGDCPSNGYTIV